MYKYKKKILDVHVFSVWTGVWLMLTYFAVGFNDAWNIFGVRNSDVSLLF